MSANAVSICLLYPDLLGTYGDGGNAVVLKQRLEWRGIGAEVVNVNMGETVPSTCDIYLLGGGEDQPQSSVTEQLGTSRALHAAVDNGATVLAVCAGMQVLGTEFAVAGNEKRAGLGLLDVTTTRGQEPRCVGEVVVDVHAEFGAQRLTGYENHGGATRHGADARPLGRVVSGRGNDDGAGTEGAVQGRIVGTYLHGPVLARNPGLADMLLQWVIGQSLGELDDAEVDDLRHERFNATRNQSRIDRVRKALGV